MRLKLSPLIALLWLLTASAVAVEPFAQIADGDRISLNLQDVEIGDLVRWAGQLVGKAIILHPNVKGRVTVVASEPMTREEAYQVFLATLQVYGYTVIDTGEVLKVIPAQQTRESDLPFASGRSAGAENMEVRIVRVRNVSAAEVAALVRPMMPQFAYLAAYGASNAILIAASAGKVAQIAEIVARLDQAGSLDIDLVSLEFANAREVAEMIADLLPEQKKGREADSQRLKVAVDERSNSLLMTGDRVMRDNIRLLIQRLDQPLASDGNTQVLYLQYAKAEDLVPILERISGGVQTTQQKGEPAAPEASAINISANESLNALILSAPPALLTTLRGIIAKLDVRRAQVLVEALIVEVNEDLARDLGVQWQTNLDTNGKSSFGGFSALPKNVPAPGVNPGTGAVTLGGGLSLGYFSGGNLRALIRALEGETNANILSTPTILALDNEEARILVGSSVPFITGSQLRDGDGEFGDPFQTIEREDIGVTLKIKPRINTNNSVTLDIEQKVETLDQTNIATADVITNKREIKTRVLIDNDQVLVLGGLIRDEASQSESKVPLLGDIPGLGRLFRSTSSTVTKKNLMVFIHPVILRDSLGTDVVSRERYQRMELGQRKFGAQVDHFFVPPPVPELPELPAPAAEGAPAAEAAEPSGSLGERVTQPFFVPPAAPVAPSGE